MRIDWEETTFGEVTEAIFSGGTPNTRAPEYWNGSLNWLSSGETRNRFITHTEKTITELGVKESSTRLSKELDVVVASAGQGHTRGQTSLLKVETYINQSLIALRANLDYIDPYYLFYNLTNRYSELRHYSDGNSSRGSITTKMIKDLPILLPPINEQKAIVSILRGLDDKIELNLRMNTTLEEIGLTLYKHWFVDFGPFQDSEFIDSELGPIPIDWKVANIGEAIEIIGGGTPKTSENEYWNDGEINWFSPTDLTSQRSLFITNSSKKITKLGLEKSSAKLFPPYSIMMTSRATIGEISINRKPSSTNQGFITLIPNENFDIYQLYFWLKTNMEKIMSISNGSTFKEVSKTNFKLLPILKSVNTQVFTRKCENLFKQIEVNLIEIDELTELRDFLLPRLLSGEVNPLEMEKKVEKVL